MSSPQITKIFGFLACAERLRSEPQHGYKSSHRFSPHLVVLFASREVGCCWRFHATKAEMIGTGADFPFSSGPHYIARAVLIRAQERSAPMGALFLGRFGGVVW